MNNKTVYSVPLKSRETCNAQSELQATTATENARQNFETQIWETMLYLLHLTQAHAADMHSVGRVLLCV
jgi:hypothetical protein